MQHRHCPETANRSLQDIRNDLQTLFGGITVVFGGDFRQILPVVPKGSREQIVDAPLRRSLLWTNMLVLHLTQNMRLPMLSHEDVTFARWLLDFGNNALPKDADNNITLPPNIVHGGEIEPLISKIYDGIEHHSDEYFKDRIILFVKNDVVDAINNSVLQLLPGES